MKKQMKKLICGIFAAALAAAVFTACTDKNPNETTAQPDGTTVSSPEDQGDITSTRPLEEGDTYAINKISNKTEGDTLPGGYKLVGSKEEEQIKVYSNGESGIRIVAVNYVEDFPEDMASWADSASANIVLNNMMTAKTQFGDPSKATVCGFDAIMYDYDMAYYDYSNYDGTEGNLKTEDEVHSGRNYYFYSEQDAYMISFETLKKDLDEQLANFEKFVADLQVTKTEY